MLPYVSHPDVPDNLLVDYGDGGGGLRCPDDLLETVMNNLGPDNGFLRQEALVSASPPPQPPPVAAGGDDAVLVESAETVLPTDDGDSMRQREDDDVCGLLFPGFMDDTATGLDGGGLGELFPPPALGDLCNFFPDPDDMMVLTDMDYLDSGGLDAFGGGLLPALDDVSSLFPVDDMALTDTGGGLQEFGGAAISLLPPHAALPVSLLLPVHAAPELWAADAAPWAARSVDTSPVSLAVCPSSARVLDYFVVPRKRRSRPATCLRRNHTWSPNCLLDAGAANRINTAPRNNPSSGNIGKGKGGSNGVGGSSNPVPRQMRRNRSSQRVCSHCERSDTPQWRAGPEGPGTLCNACGIRHGMGKLHPAYRPTSSPSFDSDKHSNRHRKVVKLMEQNANKLMMVDDATTVLPPKPGPDAYASSAMSITTPNSFI